MTTAQPPDMTQTSPPPPCTFDDEYYWDFITFSVQDRLYRVPKYRFISDSESFASKYGLDGDSAGSKLEFSNEDPLLNAVKLDVGYRDFGAFLKVLYPKKGPGHGDWKLSIGEWLAVLKLSTKWFFNDIRKIAIDELTQLDVDATDRVILGKEYAVESWFLAGCKTLVERDAVISNQEAQKIQWETANGLWAVRETWRSSRMNVRPKTLSPAYDAGTAIRDLFASDFEIIKASQSSYMTSMEKAEAAARQKLAEEEERRAIERASVSKEEEAEHNRLRSVVEGERKKLQALEAELNQRRKNMDALSPVHAVEEPDTPCSSPRPCYPPSLSPSPVPSTHAMPCFWSPSRPSSQPVTPCRIPSPEPHYNAPAFIITPWGERVPTSSY